LKQKNGRTLNLMDFQCTFTFRKKNKYARFVHYSNITLDILRSLR
jgi:hypothetical protein